MFVFSADSHIVEPPDLFESGLPATRASATPRRAARTTPRSPRSSARSSGRAPPPTGSARSSRWVIGG
jgi:hypothetical protein